MSDKDMEALIALNAVYIRSVQNSDTECFGEILAPDFYCSTPDGSLLDREKFLTQAARPVTISALEAKDVLVRKFGDFAVIHARTEYRDADGKPRAGRYTDVWARRDGRWVAIAAHVTR